MSKFRMDRNTTEHYTSFEDLAKAYGCKPVTKQTSDKNKLKKQQENFCDKNKCRACGKSMSFVTGNVMACQNPECKGIKWKRIDKEGNEIITYLPSYNLLNDRSANIANNIFA